MIPRSEHPRPDFCRENWLCLNGLWDFSIGSPCYDRQILVPFSPESQLSGVEDRRIENREFWYRRSVAVPPSMRGKRLLLHFGAVDYLARVYVNGSLAIEHEGGQTAFETDITGLVDWDGPNCLEVCAIDDPLDFDLPRGKQYWKPESESLPMNVNTYLASLVQYGLDCGLIEPCDRTYMTNQLLQALALDHFLPAEPVTMPLEKILKGLLDDAAERDVCGNDIVSRDLLDTRLMGVLTPAPREVRKKFAELYRESPEAATNWYYRFSQDTDYIRRYRIQKDMRWKTDTEYGELDITINLSKPEKDPRAIAAAKHAPQSGYPKCLLCPENEGYAGRMDHPARQNHRVVPIQIAGADWFLQYSPYVYYNEHCIVFNSRHIPMKIDREAFAKLLLLCGIRCRKQSIISKNNMYMYRERPM